MFEPVLQGYGRSTRIRNVTNCGHPNGQCDSDDYNSFRQPKEQFHE